jgi:seryl-tRNA synthetase
VSNVKAEIDAVRGLRAATGTYAERLRGVIAAARRELAAADARLAAGVDRGRGNVNRAQQSLTQARQALGNCAPEQRAAASAAVAAAQQQVNNATQLLDRARRAKQQGTEASSELMKVLHQVSAAVDQHNSAASAALAELDHRLVELTGTFTDRLGRRAREVGEVVVVTVGAIEVLAELSAPLLPPSQSPAPVDHRTAIVQMTEGRKQDDWKNLGDHVAGRQERQSEVTGDTGRWNPETSLDEDGET